MINIDRSIAPAIEHIESAEMQPVLSIENKFGIPIFVIKGGAQPVVKIEVIFDAGIKRNSKAIVPSFVNGMLEEGTNRHNAKAIVDAIDSFGAFIETDVDRDFASVSLFTLSKFLPQTLPWLMEIIFDSSFPNQEFEIMRKSRMQRFQVNMEKVGFVAGKKFMELIFPNTPYEGSFELNDYHDLNSNSLIDFYREFYKNKGITVIVSGKVDDTIVDLIKAELDSYRRDLQADNVPFKFPDFEYVSQQCFIEKSKAMQSAIRIGRPMFTKTHEDYFGMAVLNKVLGGYFGSRLMKNIREDKGYTYGIGSGLASLQNSGYFYIATEVGSNVTADALKEIYKEIDILQQHEISADELSLVKQYMLGTMLKSFDGPFEQAERFKSVYFYGVTNNYYENYFEAIRNIEASQLLNLAQKYLQKSDLTELIVGAKT